MRIHEIIPGQLYTWIGFETTLNEYTRTEPTPTQLAVTPKTLGFNDIFVALKIMPVVHASWDIKILTLTGDIGYLFRRDAVDFPAIIMLSPYQLL